MKRVKDTPLRGAILQFLRDIYPEGVERRTIVSVFYQYHTYETIDPAMEYLVDKEYASRKDVPHPYRAGDTISIYRITTKGIDLLDGLLADPAVLIPREE
jgi:DNA-binding PadR family transcriptional regulator